MEKEKLLDYSGADSSGYHFYNLVSNDEKEQKSEKS